MPTIEENRTTWASWDWSLAGSEWSENWGSPDLEWSFTILPRIRPFLPAPTILEIAPGFGRWTQFLKDACDHLMVVDLTPTCIEGCRQKFRASTNIEYFVNDGISLDMIPDRSVDFVFSFDSLVHAEPDVVEAYLGQLGRKLTPDGVGVIHHSNLGQHSRFLSRLPRTDFTNKSIFRLAKKIHPIHRSWRAPAMTAEKFREYAERADLQCVSQEKVNWQCRRTIDCISIFAPPGSKWSSDNIVIDNPRFMREATYVRTLAPLYAASRYRRSPAPH